MSFKYLLWYYLYYAEATINNSKMVPDFSKFKSAYFNDKSITEVNLPGDKITQWKPSYNPDNFSLTAEGGKNFFRYLKSFNLPKGSHLLILSPNNHYFYDESDLKNVRTLINLKKFNLIRDPDKFLKTLSRILPPDVNFIGCFSDSKSPGGNGFISDFSTKINNLLDAKTDRSINKKEVSELLERNGFKVIDMSEMGGLTYFYSYNIQHSVKKRA